MHNPCSFMETVMQAIASGLSLVLLSSAAAFPCEIPRARHALIIGIDGLAPFGIEAAETPAIDALCAAGSWSFTARTVFPSVSACGWGAILLGGGPSETGIASNEWWQVEDRLPAIAAEDGLFPGLFACLKAQQPRWRTAVSHRWDGIARLIPIRTLDHLYCVDDDDKVVEDAVRQLIETRPELTFVHIDVVDYAGHDFGWRSEPYTMAVARADWYVGELLRALETSGTLADTLVLLVSDHGGKASSHGGISIDEMFVPWIIAGPGIRRGHRVEQPVHNIDVPPTVVTALGLKPDARWIGRLPQEIVDEGLEQSGLRAAPPARDKPPVKLPPPAVTGEERKSTARAHPADCRFVFDAHRFDGSRLRADRGALHLSLAGVPRILDTEHGGVVELSGDGGYFTAKDGLHDLSELPVSALTVGGWVRVDATQPYGGILGVIQDNGGDERGFLLGFNSTAFMFALSTEGGADRDGKLTFLPAQAPLTPGCWTHIVATFDGTEMKLYLNGELSSTSKEQRGDILYPTEGGMIVGAYKDRDELFPMKGAIHEVVLKSSAMTADEIREWFGRNASLMRAADGR